MSEVRKDCEKLFSHLETPEPPEGLFDKIMQRIHKEQLFLTLKRRIILFSMALAGSAAALISTFRILQTGLVESGFMEFLSLFFSDFGVVTAQWQNFTLALMEALPAVSIAAFLAAIFIFLEALKFLIRDMRVVFTPVNNY